MQGPDFIRDIYPQPGVKEIRLVTLWWTRLVGKGMRVDKVLSRPCEYMYDLVA